MRKIYYILRDLYANAKDIKKYATVRSDYFGTSYRSELIRSFRIMIAPERTVLCYPERPSGFHVLYKLMALAGYRLSTNRFREKGFGVWAHNRTVQDPVELNSLRLPAEKIINSRCVDTDKRTIGKLYRQIFERDLDLDPLKHSGPMVKKSVINGTNDAEVITGPLREDELENGFVYQKEIDNRNTDGLSVIYRVPVFRGFIPLVFIKYRSEADRFRGQYDSVEIASPSELFSDDELKKTTELARRAGLEFGECDVLRHKDGEIYVIDLNNHPGGPPFRMNASQKKIAGRLLVDAFRKLFEDKGKQDERLKKMDG